ARSVDIDYCAWDGSGFDAALGLYRCDNTNIGGVDSNSSGYWGGGCETYTYTMGDGEILYVDADTYNGYYGDYRIRFSY
ncbi:MAG: hypothetical protein R6V85_04700, partial [Polyangia bacterium]